MKLMAKHGKSWNIMGKIIENMGIDRGNIMGKFI